MLDYRFHLGDASRYVRIPGDRNHAVGSDKRNPVDIVDIRTRYCARRPLAPVNNVARISWVGRVGTQRGDDLAESQDIGVEVVADSGLSHAASGVVRDVS